MIAQNCMAIPGSIAAAAAKFDFASVVKIESCFGTCVFRCSGRSTVRHFARQTAVYAAIIGYAANSGNFASQKSFLRTETYYGKGQNRVS
ncbi:hypothetical protein N9L06_07030, partial [Mariniblastus sp.]|nr:hypothetical protein [Mariniblastus sp.]